jgi:hypothetical protein
MNSPGSRSSWPSPATVLAGDPLGVVVRFVDPGTGRTLMPDQWNVLFTPPARVFALMSQAAQGSDR